MTFTLLGQQSATHRTLAFYVYETVVLVRDIGSGKAGQKDINLKLEKKYFVSSISQS